MTSVLDRIDTTTKSNDPYHLDSTPSPSSSHSSSQCSLFESPHSIRGRRYGDSLVDPVRRASGGSMTSWTSLDDGVFKPPDDIPVNDNDKVAPNTLRLPPSSFTSQYNPSNHAGSSTESIPTYSSHSPHEVTTPDTDHIEQYQNYLFPDGSISPASSVTSTSASKGEATPRAELPPPVWPLTNMTPAGTADMVAPPEHMEQDSDAMDVDGELPDAIQPGGKWHSSYRHDGSSWRRKHGR